MKKSLVFLNIIMVLLLVTSIIAYSHSNTYSKTVHSDNFKTDNVTKNITQKKVINVTEFNRSMSNKTNKNITIEKEIVINETDINKTQKDVVIGKLKRLTAEQKNAARNVCENKKDRKKRIRCRLKYIKEHKEKVGVPSNKAPEACRGLGIDKKSRCKQLYKNSKICYVKKGKDKNKCFKRLANFAKAKLKDEKENKNKKSRDYVILLLLDIQDKIEKAIENERVDEENGAEAINKIVEIKEDILNGIKKNDIKPKMLQLRTLLKDLKSKIDQDAN